MSGVFFGGKFYVSPVTASAINDDALRNKNLTVGNSVALVGPSAGGKPKTALVFGTPDQARATLGAGELLEAVLAAFDPSPETGSPESVTAIRVNPAVQATGVLKDIATNTVINLTSADYGVLANQIKFKIEAGSLTGLRATVQQGSTYYTEDNLHRNALSLQYSGGQASATITITDTQVLLASPAGTTVATISLAQFPTVQGLVDSINVVPGFSASVLDGNYSALTLAGLDYQSAQDVKTSPFVVTANLQAVVDWFNSGKQNLVTATRPAGAGTVPIAVPFTLLTGGSDGVTTNTDWSDAFTALQSVDVQWVTPVSSDPAIHAMTDAHVVFMSTTGRKERRAICGMALGSSDAAAIAAAKALNSDRTSLVHIGNYNYSLAGALTLFAPYHTAAIIAGAFSGVAPGTPLTNKALKVRGLERDLRNPTDTDPLILGGVLCVENTPSGYKVVKSISTWLVNSNFNRVEQSCGVALDYVARNVRNALDVLRGQKGNPIALSRAVSITDSTLKELARAEPEGPGVLAGDANNPPYSGITASLEGDVLRVQFQCSPVIPVNYVLATIYAVPFSGTVAQ